MTQSISQHTRRATQSLEPRPTTPRRDCTLIGVRAFTIIAGLAGSVLTALDLAGDGGTHLVIPAATAFILATIGGAVLVLLSCLADRQEFYRRGQLEGWMRGWRGQEPEADDPLVK